jgi:hypothetical protein
MEIFIIKIITNFKHLFDDEFKNISNIQNKGIEYFKTQINIYFKVYI